MTREIMLDKLHGLNFGMIWPPTSWDEDIGFTERPIKIDGTGWGGMYCDETSSFYKVHKIPTEKMKSLKKSVKEGTFTYDDILGTSLEKVEEFKYWGDDEFTAERFAGLLDLPDCMDDFFYCGFGVDKFEFFSTEEAFRDYFCYIDYVDIWDDLSDDVLSRWVERLFYGEALNPNVFLYSVVE